MPAIPVNLKKEETGLRLCRSLTEATTGFGARQPHFSLSGRPRAPLERINARMRKKTWLICSRFCFSRILVHPTQSRLTMRSLAPDISGSCRAAGISSFCSLSSSPQLSFAYSYDGAIKQSNPVLVIVEASEFLID